MRRFLLTRGIVICSLQIACVTGVQGQVSEKTRTEITTTLPKFTPPPVAPTAEKVVGTPAPLSADPLVELPVFRVEGLRLPDKDSDLWLTRRVLANKALEDYAGTMTELEWALNGWHIPLPFGFSLTPSAQTRANNAHTEKRILKTQKRLTDYAKTLEKLDSAEAKKLLHDLDFTNHPGK